MSDQPSTPLPDEPDHPLPPDSSPTVEQPPAPSAASPVAPPPAPPVAPAASLPPPSSAPLVAPVAGWRPGRRRGPLLPLATGLIGLMLGIVIGAAGLGLIVAVARHAHHGPAFRGDNRGQHFQDNRPVPRPGQFGRPGRPVRPGQVNPVPSPTPS